MTLAQQLRRLLRLGDHAFATDVRVALEDPDEVIADQTGPRLVNVVQGPYECPCCASVTLPERGAYELCPVCFWEDDGQDEHDADRIRGGPNGLMSLTQARANYAALGASDRAFLGDVRRPKPQERAAR